MITLDKIRRSRRRTRLLGMALAGWFGIAVGIVLGALIR